MSNEYFNLKRDDRETQVDFIKRIGKYVGWTVPIISIFRGLMVAKKENNSRITSCKGKDSGHPQVNLEDVRGTTNKDNKIIVDFKQKETEAGWIRIMDNFGLNATPIWFNWLSWVLLTGAFLYFFEKAQNIFQKIGLSTIIAISIGLLWFHFNAVFYRVEFRGIPFVKNLRRSRIASLILSGILAFGS